MTHCLLPVAHSAHIPVSFFFFYNGPQNPNGLHFLLGMTYAPSPKVTMEMIAAEII